LSSKLDPHHNRKDLPTELHEQRHACDCAKKHIRTKNRAPGLVEGRGDVQSTLWARLMARQLVISQILAAWTPHPPRV
jgi:hypothetical protein